MVRGGCFLVILGACSGDPAGPEPVAHEFPAFEIGPAEEMSSVCQSWTLGNEEPLYVNAVVMSSGRAFHHSNWFFTEEGKFPGPDGTWPCAERDFDSVAAALSGGVIYAQSTQATEEVQAFQPGAAVEIPPHSVIIGDVHLLNASPDALTTSIRLELRTIDQEDVETLLLPLELHYFPLDIPPQTTSQFASACDYSEPYGGPLDFRIHYFLPHYHDLGTGMSLEVIGGPRDGERIFQGVSPIGEPLGETLDPPFELSGATGLRFQCDYDNPRDESVGWGIGDQEMCMALAFTDGPVMWAGGVESGGGRVGEDPPRYEGPCTLYFL